MAESAKEIEIKLRLASPDEGKRRIAAAGFAIVRPRIFEVNFLLDTSAGVLSTRGETLRVRERGGETILTYKGPVEERSRHKTREEIEMTAAGQAGALLRIFARLGFGATYRYEKFRTEFARPAESGVVMLDETPIGTFLEIEGAGDWIDLTAARMGFSEKHYVNDSYSALHRRHCLEAGREIGAGMIFEGNT